MRTIFWLESLKERDHSEDLRIDGRIILKGYFGNIGCRVWIGFTWHRIETNDGSL
jgi:hypothetical protein